MCGSDLWKGEREQINPDQQWSLEGEGRKEVDNPVHPRSICLLLGVRLLNISQLNLLQEKVKNSVWHLE